MRSHVVRDPNNFDRVLKTIQCELPDKAREIAANPEVI
jgi:hypothetical protein